MRPLLQSSHCYGQLRPVCRGIGGVLQQRLRSREPAAWRAMRTEPSDAPAPAPALSEYRWSRADVGESPFKELGIPLINENAGRTRLRQHVNPLRNEYQEPIAPPDWGALFADPRRPLVVDMGCGYGRFLLLLKKRHAAAAAAGAPCAPPASNYLGLEIRRALVDRASRWAQDLGVQGSVAYLFGNATISLGALLASYPGPVAWLLVQFPDPHFKRRHHKRRIIQAAAVRDAAAVLAPGARVLLQSDILTAAESMRDAFEQHGSGAFRLAAKQHAGGGAVFFEATPAEGAGQAAELQRGGSSGGEAAAAAGALEASGSEEGEEAGREEARFESQWAAAGWLAANPVGVPTEREVYVQQQGGSVYRVLLERV